MTIQYKNQGFDLTTTNTTTVLSINTSSVAIVKDIAFINNSGSKVFSNYYLYDASATTDYHFYHQNISANIAGRAVTGVLNLEAGDAIKVNASTANVVAGVISYALIDRSQENG